MPLKPRWRLLFAPARDGAENMARDVALQDYSRRTGECVLSVYTWQRPTLSFGRNQTANGLYDVERIAREGIDVVRRPSGGRAILHNREITYSVTGADSFAATLPQAYDRINALLLLALRKIGAPVEIASPEGTAPKPDESPCFAKPVKGELIALGRKLVGSAQCRENGAFLQHGSILLEDDQAHLAMLTRTPGSVDSDAAPATLAELVASPVSARLVADELFKAVRTLQDEAATEMDETEIRPSALSLRAQFVDPLWTWRR